MLVDGKKIAESLRRRLVGQVRRAKTKPFLAVVLVGDDPASIFYIKKKQELAASVGIKFQLHVFPKNITQSIFVKQIKKIVANKKLTGFIIQLPLPKQLNQDEVLQLIPEEIDVDGLSPKFWTRLLAGNQPFLPPTIGAVKEILDLHRVSLIGKEVVIIGKGPLVGKPLACWLMNQEVTFTVIDRKTKQIGGILRSADVIITGIGQKHFLKNSMIKAGAVVIDVGTTYQGKKVFGDADPIIAGKAKLFTPTPGGVGPLTVVKLLANTVC